MSIFSTYWLVKKIDMTRSAVAHLGRQSETPQRIASLHFDLCTFSPAASDQFEPPSGAPHPRHRQSRGGQRANAAMRARRCGLPELGGFGLAAPASQREAVPFVSVALIFRLSARAED